MEKHPLCFLINDEKLYLEYVLIEYERIPLFFVCKSADKYYLSLCADIDKLSYIIVQVSPTDLYKLLHSQKSMRDCILDQAGFWEILSGSTPSDDDVNYYPIQSVDPDVLPEEGAVYEAVTEQDKNHLKSFDAIYFSEDFTNCLYRNLNSLSFTVYFDNKRSFLYTNPQNETDNSHYRDKPLSKPKWIHISLPGDIDSGIMDIKSQDENDIIVA